eukprot:GHVO01011044.1.p1 GENE.GHVO01011044.1~~GHVO01011044.1.p1  ORF type:complete len:204 (+),score=29.72 GHVO01011044.1:151-762(+)
MQYSDVLPVAPYPPPTNNRYRTAPEPEPEPEPEVPQVCHPECIETPEETAERVSNDSSAFLWHVERSFEECANTGTADLIELKHFNGLTVFTIGADSPIIAAVESDRDAALSVEWEATVEENTVSGKRKRGGLHLKKGALLCRVLVGDQTFPLHCVKSGTLLEYNDQLCLGIKQYLDQVRASHWDRNKNFGECWVVIVKKFQQ